MLTPWKQSYDQPRQHIKKRRYYFADKGPQSQSHGFYSSHARILELDHKEGWALKKNWCFWTMVLENILESSLDSKKIKPVNPKGNKPWIFIRRTDVEWSSNILATWCDSLEKTLVLGKIEGRRRTGWQRMIWSNGITNSMDLSLSTLGDSEGQGSLECYSPKESQSDLSTTAQYYPLRYNTIYNTQNNVWPNIWASHSPAKLTHEINHHSITNTIFLNYLKSGNTRLIKYVGLQLLSCIFGPYLHLSFAPNMLAYSRRWCEGQQTETCSNHQGKVILREKVSTISRFFPHLTLVFTPQKKIPLLGSSGTQYWPYE